MTPDDDDDDDVLVEYLRQYNEYPEQRDQIVAAIDERFRKTLAIVVIDTAGFTRGVGEAGIVDFLARLELLARLVVPLFERFGGHLMKREADNFFATFPDAPAATACAVEVIKHVAVANEALPADEELHISIGVGFGPLLAVGSRDVFGEEMNRACKLGEDLARHGELLITAAAYAALGDERSSFEKVSYVISGVTLDAYRLLAGG